MMNVTLVYDATGQSESLPLAATTTLAELLDWAVALFGLVDDNPAHQLRLLHDGRRLSDTALTLADVNVQDGDLLVVIHESAAAATARAPPPPQRTNASAAGSSGGLDFSNLLASSNVPNNNSTTSSRAVVAAAGASVPAHAGSRTPDPVYYAGMSLEDALHYNPHPQAFCALLQQHDSVWKALNYHNPVIAQQLKSKSLAAMTNLWRQHLVHGGIQAALRQTKTFHQQAAMQARLQRDPHDAEAQAYFARKHAQHDIDEQYRQMVEEYPESLGRVLMLYVSVHINGHAIAAFCDSGAQSTIMSKKVATECGISHLIDTRFAGTAVGVGTGKILGRIHVVQLQIASYYFPCSVTVMDDPLPGASEMPFLLGLDMMKRHTCVLDLGRGVLKFRVDSSDHTNNGGAGGAPRYLEAPFLHEKDLDLAQGGTRGFDAQAANAALEEMERRHEKGNDGDDHDDDE